MNKCCNGSENDKSYPGRHVCPVNGKSYDGVSEVTILHHIDSPWEWEHAEQAYYYCDDPDCEVVYFGLDNSVITKSSVRTKIANKEKSELLPICYCFGVNKKQARENPKAKDFVIQQTKKKACACVTRNPSGKCCLKDFPKE